MKDKFAATVDEMKFLDQETGRKEQCFVVTAIEEGGKSRVAFTGFECRERAISYARANYAPLHFSMIGEPGKLGLVGQANGQAPATH